MLSSSSGHNVFYGPAYGPAYGPSYGPAYGHGADHFLHHTETFPAIHEEHYYTAPIYHDHEEEYHKPYYKGKGNELSIRDFFEIALTALAFLAFGLFIIQLLMNATVERPNRLISPQATSYYRSLIFFYLRYVLRIDQHEYNHSHDDEYGETSEKECRRWVTFIVR